MLITILLSQFYGNEQRNQKCKEYIYEYIKKIEQIVKEGIDAKQIKAGDEKIYASEIYGLICSCLVYKLRDKERFNVGKVYKEFENTVIKGLKEI